MNPVLTQREKTAAILIANARLVEKAHQEKLTLADFWELSGLLEEEYAILNPRRKHRGEC